MLQAFARTSSRTGPVHDVLDFTGIIEHQYSRALIQRMTELFGTPNPLRRTGVVTSDPMKSFEIKVPKVQTGERRCACSAAMPLR